MDTRNRTIDIAKGIAIIAIVTGHVLRGLEQAGIFNAGGAIFLVVDRGLYLFHLAVFAFLSGLFVSRGVNRYSQSIYLSRRITSLFYLYVLWTLIHSSVSLVMASFVNSPLSFGSIFALWRPVGVYWFFPWLILMTVGAALLQPWKSGFRAIVTLILTFVISLATWGWIGDYVFTQGLGLTAFYFIGTEIGAERVIAASSRIRLGLVLVFIIVSGVLFSLSLYFQGIPPTFYEQRNALGIASGVLGSTFGTIGILAFSLVLGRVALVSKILSLIGRLSLEIFVAHILATAGVRILLIRLGVWDAGTHVFSGVVFGVGFPVLLWWVTKRLGLGALFAPPKYLMSHFM